MRDAVKAASKYLKDFEDLLPNLYSPRLEETEIDDDTLDWIVTLSFQSEPFNDGPRSYKRFWIDGQTGEVKSMKNTII